jgi:hypothetical protein
MADFEVTFVDVGHGDATLIKMPGELYMLVDVYRCPGEGIDLFKLLDDVLPEGDDGRKRVGCINSAAYATSSICSGIVFVHPTRPK